MKHRYASLYLIGLLLSAPLPLTAQQAPQAAAPTGTPEEIITQMMKECMIQSLPKDDVDTYEAKLMTGRKYIEGYCQNKNEAGARQTAQYYMDMKETATALDCGRQLMQIIKQPPLQKLIQRYQKDIDVVLAGQIPARICR